MVLMNLVIKPLVIIKNENDTYVPWKEDLNKIKAYIHTSSIDCIFTAFFVSPAAGCVS